MGWRSTARSCRRCRPHDVRYPGDSARGRFARAGYHLLDLAAPIVEGTYAAALASAGCAVAATDSVPADAWRRLRTLPTSRASRRARLRRRLLLPEQRCAAAHRLQAVLRDRVALLDLRLITRAWFLRDIFYERADVLTLSLHADPAWEYPFFIGHAHETGAGAGLGLPSQPAAAARHR